MRPSQELAGRLDWTVYPVTDSALSGGIDRVPGIVAGAVSGGARVIQVREKHASDADVAALVRACREAIASALGRDAAREVAVFVDDRLEVAVELGCHLHVGQSDTPVAHARRELGDALLLGLTVSDPDQTREACEGGHADVLGLSPIAATATKTDTAPPLGLDGARRCLTVLREASSGRDARRHASAPRAVAIGGIDLALAERLGEIGIDGVCAVSAIARAASPEDATRSLGTAVRRGRENRGHERAEQAASSVQAARSDPSERAGHPVRCGRTPSSSAAGATRPPV